MDNIKTSIRSKKDFIDVFALGRHFGWGDRVAFYRRKYGVDDMGHGLVALPFFDDADRQRTPMLLQRQSWWDVEAAIRGWVTAAARGPRSSAGPLPVVRDPGAGDPDRSCRRRPTACPFGQRGFPLRLIAAPPQRGDDGGGLTACSVSSATTEPTRGLQGGRQGRGEVGKDGETSSATCGRRAAPRFSGPLDLLSERATARIDRDAREEGIDVLRKMRRR
jgi:hypothetical protein